MPIPSQISIPNLYVPSGLESALKSFTPAFAQSYQQGQQRKQAQQQQDLRQQLANMQMQQMQAQQAQSSQMDPIALQQAQATLAQTQAKTAGMPGQQMQAQQKAQMEQDYKQRTQDNTLIKMVTNNPDLLNDPGIANRFKVATQSVSQPLYGGGQPQPQQQMQQPMQQQQQPMGQPGIQQQMQPVTTNIAEQMQFVQEQKMIPAELKNQMVRSSSARLMIDDLKGTLEQLQPFFGPENTINSAVRSFSAQHGLSDDEQGRMMNSLNKKIMATAGEVAAGMTKSRSEATLKEWQDIVNPITGKGISYKQVMDNLGALEDIHDINHDTLFANYPISQQHDTSFYEDRSAKIRKKYKKPEDKFGQVSLTDIDAELKKRGVQEPSMEQLVETPDYSQLNLGAR